MHLYVARHGQTQWNLENRVCGRTDLPLTEDGWKQAWLLAELGTHDFEMVENLLKSGALEIFTHNKTISKLRDSYRITPEQKDALVLLRRKEETL